MEHLTPSLPVIFTIASSTLGAFFTAVHCLCTLCIGMSASMYLVRYGPGSSSITNRIKVGCYNLVPPIVQLILAGILLSNVLRMESKLRNETTNIVRLTGSTLNDVQSSMKCCGVTGQSDWDEWTKNQHGQLPYSCCPYEVKECYPDVAFKPGCMPLIKEKYGKPYLTIGVVGLVACLTDFVVMTVIYFMDKDTFSKIPTAVDHVG